MPDLSVMMPIYNERSTAATAIGQVLAAEFPVDDFELVIVDDHSTDGTREWLIAQEWPENVRLVLHDRNRGKGAAIGTAVHHAQGTYATIMDADLEYDPQQIAPLLRPLLEATPTPSTASAGSRPTRRSASGTSSATSS